jgi:hypothetical protein
MLAQGVAAAAPYADILGDHLAVIVAAPVAHHPVLIQSTLQLVLAVPPGVRPACLAYINTWLHTYWAFVLHLAHAQPGLVTDMATSLYGGNCL